MMIGWQRDELERIRRRRQHNVPTVRCQRHWPTWVGTWRHDIPCYAGGAARRHLLCQSCAGNSRQYLGIPGNILSSIIWLRRHVVSKNSSAVYLAALAISDLLYLLLLIIYWHIPMPTWLRNCRDFLEWTTKRLEPLLVLVFSLERLIAIYLPLKVRFTLSCVSGRC